MKSPLGALSRPAFLQFTGMGIAAILPMIAALARLPLADDGTHDAGVVRALGLGVSGAPSLDALFAAPFLAIPVGDYALRLALGSALAVAVAGAALFALTLRSTIARSRGLAPSSLDVAVALVASLGATLSPPWQSEATAPLGSPLSSAMVLVALVRVATTGLDRRERHDRGAERRAGIALALVIALALGFWFVRRRVSPYVLPDLDASHLGPLDAVHIEGLLTNAMGPVTCLVATAGVGLALATRSSRRAYIGSLGALAIALLVVGGTSGPVADAGPERFGTASLVAVSLVRVFAGVATGALIRWVAALRLPLARGSAAMVALLAAAFPAISYDEAAFAGEVRASLDRIDWSEGTLGGVRSGTRVVTEDPRQTQRLVAASLLGEAPESLRLVPLHDVGGRLVRSELKRLPALAPLVRDATLTGLPSELAMGKLAEEVPLAVVFSSTWDRALARRLLPVGLLDQFETEPRGAIERHKRFEASERDLTSLARGLRNANALELATSTAHFLRARETALVAAGDRGTAAQVHEQVNVFAPEATPEPPAVVAPLTHRHGMRARR
jgi:hypothetical protein